MNFKETYHPEWQIGRINYITEYFGKEYFAAKTLLELAPFNGLIGNHFHLLGATVTCVEGRKENVEDIREMYPHLNTHQANLDVKDWPWGTFDIIVNWGLLYHLEFCHREVLENCIANCKCLLLETVVANNDEDIQFVSEVGIDQSLSSRGGRPNIKWIEQILNRRGCDYKQVVVPNCGIHDYSGHGMPNYNRRMWVITTNNKA
jgi:hypothetical protein